MMDFAQLLKEEQELYQHEAAVFAELAPLMRDLDMPLVETECKLQLFDRNHELKLERKFFSHSANCNFYNKMLFLCCHIACPDTSNYGQTYISGRDTSNGQKGTSAFTYWGYYGSIEASGGYFEPASSTAHGIRIGTDNTAEALNDYSLGSLIAHGTGAGQMQYSVTSLTEAWDAGNSRWYAQWDREFTNGSSGSITVNEMDMVFNANAQSNSYMQMYRDVIGGGQAVDVGESLGVTYEIRHSY
jgi:hypothetical protein